MHRFEIDRLRASGLTVDYSDDYAELLNSFAKENSDAILEKGASDAFAEKYGATFADVFSALSEECEGVTDNATVMEKLENIMKSFFGNDIEYGTILGMASIISNASDPYYQAIGALMITGATYISSDKEARSRWDDELYATCSALGIEKYLNDTSGLEAFSSAGIGVGSLILSGISLVFDAYTGQFNDPETGAFSPSIAAAKVPEVVLQSTVYTIVHNTIGAALDAFNPYAGELIASTAANAASQFCLEPFREEDGTVNPWWCLGAEGGTLLGTGLGFAAASELVAAGTITLGPAGLLVLALAATGYGVVAATKYGIDNYDPNRESVNPSNTGNPWSWRDFQPSNGDNDNGVTSTVTTDDKGVETVTASDNEGNSVRVTRNPDGSYSSTEHRSDGTEIVRADDGQGNHIEITRNPDGSSETIETHSDGTTTHTTIDSSGKKTVEPSNSESN